MEHLINLTQDDNSLDKVMTPNTKNKKNSQLENAIEEVFKNKKNKIKIFAICGGQSCGKTKIANYFLNKIDKSILISERDFYKGSHNIKRRKSYEEKELFMISDDNNEYSKDRKKKLVNLSDPECYDWNKLKVFSYK